MRKNLPKLVRAYLIFGAFYMLVESLVHFSNVKLLSVNSIWPKTAVTFTAFMSILYASTALFLSAFLLILQTNIQKYQQLIRFIALYALFHGGLMLVASFNSPFDQIYKGLPSLALWIPYYNFYLIFEAMLLFGFTILVYFWQKNR